MKNLIKNDNAVSVVVGAILILAVLVTFMSVFTSTWVPIYEGNAESAHSDDTNKAFMDIHKQIELADEFSKSASIDLGTEQMSFIKNSNSVGILEVNESDGDMFVTGNVTHKSTAWGEGFQFVGMDTNETEPITNFSFEFTQMNFKSSIFSSVSSGEIKLNPYFMIKIWTTELNRWITLYPYHLKDGFINDGYWADEVGIWISYEGNITRELWSGKKSVTAANDIITVSHPNVSINLLATDQIMELIEPATLAINGTIYTNSGPPYAPLNDVIQHYMRLPGDGTGGNYDLNYVQYDGILDANQYITYETADDATSIIVDENNDIKVILDDFKVGGGTLKLQSDYNFMVDQSYIYDSGAVILNQYDGAVFKTASPIVAINDSGNLILTLKSTVLKGDYQASGNGIETLYTTLDRNMYEVRGVTDNITIVKNTTPELYPLWDSYFSDLGDIVNSTSANYNDMSNSSINQAGIRIYSTTPDITITVQKKVIAIS